MHGSRLWVGREEESYFIFIVQGDLVEGLERLLKGGNWKVRMLLIIYGNYYILIYTVFYSDKRNDTFQHFQNPSFFHAFVIQVNFKANLRKRRPVGEIITSAYQTKVEYD